MKKLIIIAVGLGVIVVAGAAFNFLADTKQLQATVDQSDPQVVANGEAVYGQYCASCHGNDLEGQPNWKVKKADGVLPAPPHNKDGHTWHHSDNILFGYTKDGGESLGIEGFKSGMPSFKNMLKNEQIWSVLAYIKSRWPEKYRARQENATQKANQQGLN